MALACDSKRPAKEWTEPGTEDLSSPFEHEIPPASNDAEASGEVAQVATYARLASRTLGQLCEATGHGSRFWQCLETQQHLFDGWGDTTVPEIAPYPSNIGDDHSPYEYSLALHPAGGVELRLLVEAQAEVPSALANQQAALDLNERLRRHFGLSFARFDAIKDLFLAETPSQFSLWHAVCWTPNGGTDFKLYLNPQAAGPEHALQLTKTAFERLGLGDRSHVLDQMIRRRELDEIKYFSLDLSSAPGARVKVYAAHHAANAADVEAVVGMSPAHRPGDIVDYCNELLGNTGPFERRAVTTCLSFTGESRLPTAATFHLPIAHYLHDDEETMARVSRFLRLHALDAGAYEQAFSSMAPRPLGSGHSTQSYVSLRRGADGLRITTYLSPRLFREHAERR